MVLFQYNIRSFIVTYLPSIGVHTTMPHFLCMCKESSINIWLQGPLRSRISVLLKI